MPRYYTEWTDKTTGGTYRLDIVTHDDTYDTTPTALTGDEVVSVVEMTREFDELPVGVMKPPTLKVVIDWGVLSSTEKGYLREPTSLTNKNMWVFSTDFGSGSVIEFCGFQANSETAKYTMTPDGRMTVEYELVDMYYDVLAGFTWSGGGSGKIITVTPYTTAGGGYGELFDVDFQTPNERADYYYSLKRANTRVQPAALESIIEEIATTLTGSTIAVRGNHYGSDALKLADVVGDGVVDSIKTFPTSACTFYKSATAPPRAIGSSVSGATLLVPAYVNNNDGGTIGGYCAYGDELGLGQYQSGFDWLRDLAENFAVKIMWTYAERTASGGTPYIGVEIDAVKIYSTKTGTVPSSVDLTSAILKGDVEVEEGYAVVGKGETQWEGGSDDLTDISVINASGSTRTQRSFTARVKIHNNPRVKDNVTDRSDAPIGAGALTAGYNDAWTVGLDATDTLCYITTGNALARVHETVAINDGNTNTTYSVADSEDPPTGGFSAEDHVLWCLSVQEASGLSFALASFYATRFGDKTQTLVTFSMPLEQYVDRWCDVGTGITISGLSDLSHITTSNGQVVSHTRNYEDGTMTLKVLLCP